MLDCFYFLVLLASSFEIWLFRLIRLQGLLPKFNTFSGKHPLPSNTADSNSTFLKFTLSVSTVFVSPPNYNHPSSVPLASLVPSPLSKCGYSTVILSGPHSLFCADRTHQYGHTHPDNSGEVPSPTCSFLPWPNCSPSTSVSAFPSWIPPPFQSPFLWSCHHIIFIACDFPCLQFFASSNQSSLYTPRHICSLIIASCHSPGAAGSSALAWIFQRQPCLLSAFSLHPRPSYMLLQVICLRHSFVAVFSSLKIRYYFPIAPELGPVISK